MTRLPVIEAGQRWLRRDGSTVVLEACNNEDYLYAAGTYYRIRQDLPKGHTSIIPFENYDLVELFPDSPPKSIRDYMAEALDVLDGEDLIPFDDSEKVDTFREAFLADDEVSEGLPGRTIDAFGFNDGVFCAVGSDGTAWYLSLFDAEAGFSWHGLPRLPQGD